MPIVLPEHKLVYLSVPKCACSSLKRLFYQIETGVNPAGLPQKPHLHKLYPSEPFAKLDQQALSGFAKVAVLRDPVERFFSAYRDKVLRKQCLHMGRRSLSERVRRLNRDPSLEEFLDRIDHYRRSNAVVRRHFAPLTHFLGEDPAWFTRLFPFSKLDEMQAYVAGLTGIDIPLTHANKTPRRHQLAPPDPAVVARIESLYARDYEVFGTYL